MTMLTGLFTLALLGGGTPGEAPLPASPSGPVRFDIRFLEMKGVDWRGAVHGKLAGGERQGASCVWTAGREVMPALEKAAERTMSAPAVTAEAGARATVSNATVHTMVTDVRRVSDAAPGQRTRVAFVPEIGEVRDGFEVQVSGQPAGQGVLTALDLRDTRILAFHSATLRETIVDAKTGESRTVSPTIQVPELAYSAAKGEWLVPTDGVLVVSLGAFTKADATGQPATYERLAVIEPTPLGDPAPSPHARPHAAAPPAPEAPAPAWKRSLAITARATARPQGRPELALLTLPLLASPLPRLAMNLDVRVENRPDPAPSAMPAVPSRALPTPIASDGTVVALPPLPEDDAVLPVSAEDDGVPRAAPQGGPIALPTRGSVPAAVAAALGGRVTRFEARGNTVVVRDDEDGTCRLICEDLVLFPAPRSLPVVDAECPDDNEAHPLGVDFQLTRATRRMIPPPAPLARSATPATDDAQEDEDGDAPSLNLELLSAGGTTQYAGEVNLRAIAREPITVRVPMADGSVVEVTAKVVKKAAK